MLLLSALVLKSIPAQFGRKILPRLFRKLGVHASSALPSAPGRGSALSLPGLRRAASGAGPFLPSFQYGSVRSKSWPSSLGDVRPQRWGRPRSEGSACRRDARLGGWGAAEWSGELAGIKVGEEITSLFRVAPGILWELGKSELQNFARPMPPQGRGSSGGTGCGERICFFCVGPSSA